MRPIINKTILNIVRILKLILSSVAALGLVPHAQTTSYPLYNLSILLPLPKKIITDSPGLDTPNCSRPIFEKSLFEEVPELLQAPNSVDEQYRSMRLVGIRFDFRSDELRLVYQPLYKISARHKHRAEDAGLHLFFRMPRTRLIAEQNKLLEAYPRLPLDKLGIHPAITDKTSMAPIEKLLCEVAKEPLFKVTFMNVRGGRMIWNFGGFLIHEEHSGRRLRGQDVVIANSDGLFMDEGDADMSVQRVTRFSGSYQAQVLPRVVRGDNLSALFAVRGSIPVDEIRSIRRSVDRIENPKLNTPQTVDCTSCHATESARIALEDQHNSKPSVEAYALPKGYELDQSINRESLRNTANFRAFGYIDDQACINRRVLNETTDMQQNGEILSVLQ